MSAENVSFYDTSTLPILSSSSKSIQDRYLTKFWYRIMLILIVTLSFFLNFFRLPPLEDQLVWKYYAAAVRSMLLNWKNFFFVSFDPKGFVSVDKPPLDLWLQTASAKLFGFSPWSLVIPQALAGVLTVIVLFLLVRRFCGPAAGLLAALVMATMPIIVETSRSNNIDMLLILIVLLAAWALHHAVTAGKLRWLMLAAALIGLGFNAKGLEAYLVLPAFGLFYLLGYPQSWSIRLVHLTLALCVLLVVSFAWVVAVDLTPANQRPYVGSSQTNSALELMMGFNGISRLVNTKSSPVFTESETGAPGPFRLFDELLGGYIAWLLPLAMIGMLALGWRNRIRLPLDCWQQVAVFWGLWLLTGFVFFSTAYFFHNYYLTILSPAIAALAACGLVTMWHDYCERPFSDWRGWALPVALGLTAMVQVYLLFLYPGWRSWQNWLLPLVMGLSFVAVVILVSIRLHRQEWSLRVHICQCLVLVAGILALLVTPLTWSGVVALSMSKGGLVLAGPSKPSNGAKSLLSNDQRKLVGYLRVHRGHTRFLLATISASSNSKFTARLMLEMGESVMTLGGYDGTDPILTVSHLKHLVADGKIRFFWLPAIYTFHRNKSGTFSHSHKLVPGSSAVLRKYRHNSALIQWVNRSCKLVPRQIWYPVHTSKSAHNHTEHATSTSINTNSSISNAKPSSQLFDCSSAR